MSKKHRPCSVVLEGGVTSAVLYASLLAELSKAYTFRQLGGASSGAVAAAAAAAAEFSRSGGESGNCDTFPILGQFPGELAKEPLPGRTVLFDLFQPRAQGRASLSFGLSLARQFGTETSAASWVRLALPLACNFWGLTLFLAIGLIALGLLAARGFDSFPFCSATLYGPWACGGAWLVFFVVAGVAALIFLLIGALWRTVSALKNNHWGLCNGMATPGAPGNALTPMLHALLQDLAGLPVDRSTGRASKVLTFGDLWRNPGVQLDATTTPEPGRHIDLQVITTAVNLKRPVRLPGTPGDDPLRAFFYDPIEWKDFFPDQVLGHLRACARPVSFLHPATGRELCALPAPAQWPVLMAVRFSLSFPVLLSAVPMYIALPTSAPLSTGAANAFVTRKIYFSDGGITSNCPVHLFDAPLPDFPTFGINLYDLRERPKGKQKPTVFRSDTRDPEIDAAATQDAGLWTTPLSFVTAIVSTMLDWRDSLQRNMPGSCERMVHIGVPPQAGGLNLAMRPATIVMLAEAGIAAAKKLIEDFSTPLRSGETNAWERHRWTRARTTLTALRNYLADFVDRLKVGEPDYVQLLRTTFPDYHPFQNEAARKQALDLAAGAQVLVGKLNEALPPDALDKNSPEPQPALHMSPPW